jgi:hypothetical protein
MPDSPRRPRRPVSRHANEKVKEAPGTPWGQIGYTSRDSLRRFVALKRPDRAGRIADVWAADATAPILNTPSRSAQEIAR